MLFRFFRFLIYVYFNETFVKKLMKKLSFFNTIFQNSFEDVVYYRMSKTCDTCDTNAKFEKMIPFL